MLKSCWACIAGERLDNEMIGTTNGLSQKTAWSEQNNEIIFQLPRGLYVDRQEGTVVIRGQLIQNKERLRIGLTSGAVNSQKKILYYITFDYVGDEITVARDENGSLVIDQNVQELSNLSVDSDFIFHMKFKHNDQGELVVAPMFGSYGFNNVPLLSKTDLRENIFITIYEDTLKNNTVRLYMGLNYTCGRYIQIYINKLWIVCLFPLRVCRLVFVIIMPVLIS